MGQHNFGHTFWGGTVGDVYPLKLTDGRTIDVMVVDVNSDYDTTFSTKNKLENRAMFDTLYKVSKSWSDADLRAYLNSTGFYDLLPINIKNAIKQKTALYYKANQGNPAGFTASGEKVQVTDRIWIPRIEDVYFYSAYKYPIENDKQLQYYAKSINNVIKNEYWWVAAPSNYSTGLWRRVSTSTNVPYGDSKMTDSIAVFPHFIIGGT